ncbi:AraC family transcriptional regulator [Cohaesibacter sp. CAU 1516]|nr:AraC family transcriptional regulator [Cohaesibacter sp. CAU 1516]
MPNVTFVFARTMAKAAGMSLSEDGCLWSDGEIVHRVAQPADGRLIGTEYFDLIEWIRTHQRDEVALVATYANLLQAEDLGVLGLAIKTAPTLRTSLARLERYYRLATDTAIYRLKEETDRAALLFEEQTEHHTALDLRNECALAAFARNMYQFVGPSLTLDFVSFRHACRSDPQRYADYFKCPVIFEAEQNSIAMHPTMLDLPNRVGDKAVFDFMVGHLETEIESLADTSATRNELLHRLTANLSSGVPHAAAMARDMGMSERTLYRRLSEEGMTYRDVVEQAQSALARELLRESKASIAEIAFLTGFSEQSTFSRAFKRWEGQAPARYRQATLS